MLESVRTTSINENPSPLVNFSEVISLKQVTFSYLNEQEAVFENFSFNFEFGKTYAVIGPSGAGKSTLLDLVCGFIFPQRGTVQFDNQFLTEDNSRAFQQNISIVSQNIFLFEDTLRNNITLFDNDFDQKRFDAALDVACLRDLVDRLEGVDQSIGEGGETLSGGEKQRISIARAVYSGCKLLILDEPTSALDAGLEKLVVDKLSKLIGITKIFVTHKSYVLTYCDDVIDLSLRKNIH